ncbi:hypothetical protein DFH06DRAFT_535286 [Mycena polygramma]|nr:hypothetical protein DFH06DRAFT_535286 [Mycena polygramma]
MSDPYFPNEVLLDLFTHVVDGSSLRAVVLASQRFHNLGLQELLRTLVWHSTEKAQANIGFWERNDNSRRLFPTALAFNLNDRKGVHANESHPAILRHISWFKSLKSLSISNAALAVTFYEVLANLPTLTHLSLVKCPIANAPPHFPSSFPSFSAGPVEISVTDLTLAHVWGHKHVPADEYVVPVDTGIIYRYRRALSKWTVPLFKFLPHLTALTLDTVFSAWSMPRSLPEITTLSIVNMPLEDAIMCSNSHLRIMPNLQHLHFVRLYETPMVMRPDDPDEDVDLPWLQSFTGPAVVATSLVSRAPLLTALTINLFIAKTTDALALIEATNVTELRQIELRLRHWDDQLMLTVMYRLCACEDVKILWRFGQPSERFLLDLGVKNLPLLPQLRTLHLHAVAPVPVPNMFQRRQHRGCGTHDYIDDAEEGEDMSTGINAEVPTEASCEEYIAAWTQYNSALRSVRLVEGREWVRLFVGGRWEVGSVKGGGCHAVSDDDEDAE